jgi:hypothetical protein
VITCRHIFLVDKKFFVYLPRVSLDHQRNQTEDQFYKTFFFVIVFANKYARVFGPIKAPSAQSLIWGQGKEPAINLRTNVFHLCKLWPCSQTLKMLVRDKRSSLFVQNVIDEEKKFITWTVEKVC